MQSIRFCGSTILLLVCLGQSTCFGQRAVAAPAAQPTYQPGDINRAASRVFTRVYKKTSLGHEHAVEGLILQGNVHLDREQAVGEITFDMRSFAADTATARKYLGVPGDTSASMQEQVNANMRSSAVLDVAKYPTAVFTIERATAVTEKSGRGLPQYQLVGSFTLHGTTKPLTLVADIEEKNGWTHLRCAFNVRQTSFGIKPFAKAFGAIGVADELTIYGDLWVAGTIPTVARRSAPNDF